MADPIFIIIILVVIAIATGLGIYGYIEYNKLEKKFEEKDSENSEYVLKSEEDSKKLSASLVAEKAKSAKIALDAVTALEEEKVKATNISVNAVLALDLEKAKNAKMISDTEIALADQKIKEETILKAERQKFLEEQVVLLTVKENISREEAIKHIEKMGIKWIKNMDGNLEWSIKNYMRYIYDGVLNIVWKTYPDKCFDAANVVKNTADSYLWTCTDHPTKNQGFVYDNVTNQFRLNRDKDVCITRQGDKQNIQMSLCAKPENKEIYKKQIFAYNDVDQIYSLDDPTQCLDVFEGKTANSSKFISHSCDKASTNQRFNFKKNTYV